MIVRQLVLQPAQPADIPFIMATERIPGFEIIGWALVGRRSSGSAKSSRLRIFSE
jgi:hypothetical protein